MSLSQNYPTTRPTLTLDFAKAKRVDPRVTFTRASTATYFDASGTLRSAAANAPRIDFDPATLACRGLLVEEQRTNSIRNNTMQGAAAGTPGTLPTNWGEVLSGLTREVVGSGLQNGVAYIDIRFSGTTTSTQASVRFEPISSIPGSVGQSWSISSFVSIAAGSLANISTVRVRIIERDASANYLTESSTTFSPNSALSRFTHARTLSSATVAFVVPDVFFTFASGVAIDITLRIGLPQLEQGAFATSVIPTSGTAVTRSADVVSITGANFSSWYRQDEGCGFIEAFTAFTGATGADFYRFGTVTNGMRIGRSGVGATPQFLVADNGTSQAGPFAGSLQPNVFAKMAAIYKVDDFAISTNGSLPSGNAVDTSGSVPQGITTVLFMTGVFGCIRRFTFWPQRPPNSTLQNITL